MSGFYVPQGRSRIAQRFIAGLWREDKTSPVRDERTRRSSPFLSFAPLGLWRFSTRNPRLKPWATFGRPYLDIGSRALQSFNMRSTGAFSRRENTENTVRDACAGTTVSTYAPLGEEGRGERVRRMERHLPILHLMPNVSRVFLDVRGTNFKILCEAPTVR